MLQRWLALGFTLSLTFFLSQTSVAQVADEVVGQVEISVSDDFSSKRSEVLYHVREKLSGKMIQLREKKANQLQHLKSGQTIRVRGTKKNQGQEMEVESVEAQAGDGASTTTEGDAQVTVAGRKILIVLVNLNDGTAVQSASSAASDVAAATNSVSHMFHTVSTGLYSFNVDGNGDGQPDVVTANVNLAGAGNCNYYSWSGEADKIATAQGINLSNYQHLLYVLPNNVGCSWGGVGNMPGIRTWVRFGGAYIKAHELGHNLGLHHAATDTNNDGVVDNEYGDSSCVMGNHGSLKGVNGAHAAQLGVYSAFSGKVLTGGSGLIELGSVDTHPLTTSLPQIYRIKKSDTNDYYYVTYRNGDNYGANLSSSYSGRINIHRYTGSGSSKTLFIRSLGLGETFTDSKNGIDISAVSKAADSSSMGIQVSGNCSSQQPSVSINPASIILTPSGSAQATLTLKNNDNDLCAATTFSVATSASTGFLASTSQTSVTLAALESVTLQVPVSTSLSSGSGSVYATISDNDGRTPNHAQVQVQASVSVDSTAPTAPTNLSASTRKGKVNLSWTASSDSGSGVAEYRIFRGGVQIGTSTTTSFADSSASGTVTYQVVAVDRAGNISAASNSVTLSLSTSSTSGGGSTKGGGGSGGKGRTK